MGKKKKLTLDVFGITELIDTTTYGKVWYSTTFSGQRSYSNTGRYDGKDYGIFWRLTDSNVTVSGSQAVVDGPSPRLFIDGPWLNTEVTCYVKAQTGVKYVHIGSRSSHDRGGSVFDKLNNKCAFGRYNVKFNHYINKVACDKEPMHPFHIQTEQDANTWSQGIGSGVWTGLKTITRTDTSATVSGNFGVRLEGYVDHTEGLSGGTWVKKTEWLDTGSVPIDFNVSGAQTYIDDCKCVVDRQNPLLSISEQNYQRALQPVYLDPARQCMIRVEEASGVALKWISVREIPPIN